VTTVRIIALMSCTKIGIAVKYTTWAAVLSVVNDSMRFTQYKSPKSSFNAIVHPSIIFKWLFSLNFCTVRKDRRGTTAGKTNREEHAQR
jgi:hypothetical protein